MSFPTPKFKPNMLKPLSLATNTMQAPLVSINIPKVPLNISVPPLSQPSVAEPKKAAIEPFIHVSRLDADGTDEDLLLRENFKLGFEMPKANAPFARQLTEKEQLEKI